MVTKKLHKELAKNKKNNDIRGMETQTKKVEDVQGTETTKKQKPSATYTLTQFTEMINKLQVLELLNGNDIDALQKIRERAKQEYIKKL